MRDYHTTSKSIHKKYYMKEFPKEINQKAREEIKRYCIENNILHDIDNANEFLQNPMNLNLQLHHNNFSFNNKHFVFEKVLWHYKDMFIDNNYTDFDYYFEDFLRDYEEEIEFFKPCIFKRSDYSITAGKSNFRWEHDRFDIIEFLKGIWNTKRFYIFKYTDDKDKDGNIIYASFKEDLIDLYK